MPTSLSADDADLARTATLKFERRRTSSASAGGIELIGGGANIDSTNKDGNDDHTISEHNLFDGYFDFWKSAVTSPAEGSFVNEGLIMSSPVSPVSFAGDI